MNYDCTDSVRDRMRESAVARGQTGFLHPICEYAVFCGTERVHSGRIKREAVHCFRRYQRWSRERVGKAAGKTIRILKDGQEFTQ